MPKKSPLHFGEPFKPVDLTAPSRAVHGRLPALEAISERLSRQVRADLFRFLRYGVEVQSSPTRFDAHDEVIGALEPPVYVGIVTMAPLRGFSAMAISGHLISAVVDRLCGASQKRPSRKHGDFSLFETRIAKRLMDVICQSVAHAWLGVARLNIEVIRTEVNTSFVSIADAREPLITMAMEATLSTGGGSIIIGTPLPAVEPIRDRLGSTAAMTEAPEEDRRHWTQQIQDSALDVSTTLRAELTRQSYSSNTVNTLQVGQILPVRIPQRVRVYCDGSALMTASYGRRNDAYALRIETFEGVTASTDPTYSERAEEALSLSDTESTDP